MILKIKKIYIILIYFLKKLILKIDYKAKTKL
jgi:hypothetical protein